MFRMKQHNKGHRGVALLVAMLFVIVFSALSVAFFSMSSASVMASENQHESNNAMNAALSGLEYARYIASNAGSVDVVLDYTAYKAGNFASQADAVWSTLSSNEHLSASGTDDGVDWVETQAMSFCDSDATFVVRFVRQDANTIKAICTGENGGIQRTVGMTFQIQKADDEILNYGLVGRGRMWLAGDTTIYGDIYSSWDNPNVSPFNIADDSTVLGTVNTIFSKDTVDSQSWDLETTDSDDNAMFEYGMDVYDADGNSVTDSCGTPDENGNLLDTGGNPVYDIDGNLVPVDFANRITNSDDELQGYHEGVNYGVNKNDIDTYLDISSYDTSVYSDMTSGNIIQPDTTTETQTIRSGKWPNYVYTTTEVEVPVIVTEYFPHGPDGYDDYKTGSITLQRSVISNRTITDAYLSANQNALFDNCTFEGVLYIDCAQNTSGEYNNIRFNNCTFNGVVTTNTPSALRWQYNALYFTGSANFNNTSDIQEATILAPHFNVNLGNANNGEVESDENVITGAVVGGIVDIRGNARIYGTVISMCDTSNWTSGYVTNIGATLNDGGSETTSIEDIGTIEVTPDPEQSLFPGLKEYPCTISLQADTSTYCELQ